MDISLGVEQKYSLITRRLELQNGWCGKKLQSLLTEGKTLKYQWATAPTGKPHIGYFIPLIKFADFIRAGGEVTVDLVDLYAFLVNYKFPWDQVRNRTTYYRFLITAALRAAGVSMCKISVIEMSSYQSTPEFMADFWKLCALCSQQDARETGAEVGGSTMLSPLLTPLLQELGEEYLGVDVELGGRDQRGIFNLGERFLPELGYERRAHLMNELLPSLAGGKMSSSSPAHTKILFLDDAAAVEEKITRASCPANAVQGNGVLPIVEHILMPVGDIRLGDKANAVDGATATRGELQEGTWFSVAVLETGCEDRLHRSYCTYEELERDYVAGVIEPTALKEAVVDALNRLLEPIRKMYEENEEWRRADQMAYPEDWPAE
ncbi:tRNA synthetases class I (W and y) domain-containing protein [Hirsutella rhossiliensis]|uniref:tyrosine--tRNA ligase n=1 Tax=Hirsutella rhossiliensis TaxID=111463 RepID=A0A9P8MYG0_9HYPO|nr:tRNA synthetases class I (W and y) domain-containing protein [Hirsutella rhossiliensis]KAH0961437.1 tRNA synthetases class I (W and y) domain-containing protein [Hirsutella rhossiliensis]